MKLVIVIFVLITFNLGCNKMIFDQKLKIDDNVLENLNNFKNEKKYIPTTNYLFYPGAESEEVRILAEQIINVLIENLINNIKNNNYKSYVLKEFSKTLNLCNNFDTEDREMTCHYLQKIMDILNIKSSNGLLNKWLYGFNPK